MTHKLQIVTTGGTIDKDYGSGKGVYDFHIGEPAIIKILADSTTYPEHYYDFHSLMKKDSLDMTDDDRKKVADFIASKDAKRFLVTHGTDTMIDTAEIIQEMIKNKDKTVVLTGASRPYSMKVTDAYENVRSAIQHVNDLSQDIEGSGTFISMHKNVFRLGEVKKCDDGIFRGKKMSSLIRPK